MAFSCSKLRKILIDKRTMCKGKPVRMRIFDRICRALNVNIGDVVDYSDDAEYPEEVKFAAEVKQYAA